jgi:uncharacterized membrane protein
MDDLARRSPEEGASPPPRFHAYEIVSGAIILATVVVTAALYTRLPAEVPVHFDIHARPDGWLPRSTGAFVLPALTVVVLLFLRAFPRRMPPAARERLERSPIAGVTLAVASMMSALQLFILYASLSPHGHLGLALSLALGASFIVLGQLQPRTRRNPIMGIRTPWTLSSDENWARTHRVAGITMTAGGAFGVIAGAAGYPAVAISGILASVLYPVIYSYVLARQLRKRA